MTKARKQKRAHHTTNGAMKIAYSLWKEGARCREFVAQVSQDETDLADLSDEEIVSLVLSLLCDPMAVAYYLNMVQEVLSQVRAALSGEPLGVVVAGAAS